MKTLSIEKMRKIEGGNAPFFWWVGCMAQMSYYNPGMDWQTAGTICHLAWDYAIV
jgi:hypothetical protein